MIDFQEIFTAWKVLYNPTEFQSKVASDRLNICVSCIYKREIFEKKEWSAVCGKCGCPLKAKVFSQEINPCPMGFWVESDSKNGINSQQKNEKTFL